MRATAWQMELVDAQSSKFYRGYELHSAARLILHWGRRGTVGQCKIERTAPNLSTETQGLNANWAKHLRGYDDTISRFDLELPDELNAATTITPELRRGLHDAFNAAQTAALSDLIDNVGAAAKADRTRWGQPGHIVALAGWRNEPKVHPWLQVITDLLATHAVVDDRYDVALVNLDGRLAAQLITPWIDAIGVGCASDPADTADMARTALSLWDDRNGEVSADRAGILGQHRSWRGRLRETSALATAVESARLLLAP